MKEMEIKLKELNTDRMVTILLQYHNHFYNVKDIGWNWSDDMIECLAKNYKKPKEPEPIKSRFEILDIK